ncbi:MAG TPA: glycerophosphodiester phosphodiesterase [Solirubrobacteraceae bacterium]|nr:glycerophosphodiester phosphodiesterase [Solirubrobacteraceae bacterium]
MRAVEGLTGLSRTWARTTPPEATAILAHRGAWGEVAENTLDAFENAIGMGADMIEFDVRRTGDGRLVVHHDPSRDGIPLQGVRATALSDGRRQTPRLEEVLELAQGQIGVDVELKERGCVPEVISLLRRFGVHDALLTSFHDDVVQEAKELEPALTTGLLVGRYRSATELFPAGRLKRAGADMLVIHHLLLTTGVLARTEHPCLVWTVNSTTRVDRLLTNPKVAGVITDHPRAALDQRANCRRNAVLSASAASASSRRRG